MATGILDAQPMLPHATVQPIRSSRMCGVLSPLAKTARTSPNYPQGLATCKCGTIRNLDTSCTKGTHVALVVRWRSGWPLMTAPDKGCRSRIGPNTTYRLGKSCCRVVASASPARHHHDKPTEQGTTKHITVRTLCTRSAKQSWPYKPRNKRHMPRHRGSNIPTKAQQATHKP